MLGSIQLRSAWPKELSGKYSRLSRAYIFSATPHCLQLLTQRALWDFAFALASAGKSIPARIAMIATTTSSSIKVKASSKGREWNKSRGFGRFMIGFLNAGSSLLIQRSQSAHSSRADRGLASDRKSVV